MGEPYYTITPAGLAGPYPTLEDARTAARPFGYPIVRRTPPPEGGDALVRVAGVEMVEESPAGGDGNG